MPDSTEFRMTTDLQQVLPAAIEFNYVELKAWLAESLEKYHGRVITEAEIPEAKAIAAKINRVSKAISDQRISIKKRYLEPYTTFENQCKELCSMCDATAAEFKKQIDFFAEQKKGEKIKRLNDYFDGVVGDAAPYISWENVFNPRWGNATFREEDAAAEIDDKIKRCEDDIAAILSLNSEFELTLLDEYKNTHDLSAVIRKNDGMRIIKEAAEKRKAEQAAREAALRENIVAKQAAAAKLMEMAGNTPSEIARETKTEANPATESIPFPDDSQAPPEPLTEVKEEVTEKVFRLRGTKTQWMRLKAALNEIGMKPMRV